MKNLKFLSVVLALLCIGFTSCGDDLAEDALIDTQNFSADKAEGLLSRTGNRCLEFVFPITISFADNTTATVADQEELKAAVKTWKENNLDTDETEEGNRGRRNGFRPDLVFPIQVTNEEGEIIDIASAEEFKAANAACGGGRKGQKGNRGQKGERENTCFSVVYPITLSFPDGSSQTFEDEASKKDAIQTYKEANGRGAERPNTVYPLTVEYEDGTQTSVESKEAFKTLRQACSEEG